MNIYPKGTERWKINLLDNPPPSAKLFTEDEWRNIVLNELVEDLPLRLGITHFEETKRAISLKMAGRSLSEEHKQKLSDNHWRNRDPEKHRLHVSNVSRERQKYGKSKSEKEKISNSLKQKWIDGEYANRKKPFRFPNSGKMWINDSKTSKMIDKTSEIPDGWVSGRK